MSVTHLNNKSTLFNLYHVSKPTVLSHTDSPSHTNIKCNRTVLLFQKQAILRTPLIFLSCDMLQLIKTTVNTSDLLTLYARHQAKYLTYASPIWSSFFKKRFYIYFSYFDFISEESEAWRNNFPKGTQLGKENWGANPSLTPEPVPPSWLHHMTAKHHVFTHPESRLPKRRQLCLQRSQSKTQNNFMEMLARIWPSGFL